MNAQNDPLSQNRGEWSDRRAARRQRLVDRRTGQSGSWAAGVILILIGFVVLLQNFTTFNLQNWWALILLIPALGAFSNAWRAYRSDGRISAPARSALISGFILTMVAAFFLLNLNWDVLGPVLLILAGLVLIVNVILPG